MTYCNEAYFPLLYCEYSGIGLTYKGNTYEDLWVYPYIDNNNYKVCEGYLKDNADYPTSEWDSNRQERLHTCFNGCKNSEQESGFENDSRPLCSTANPGLLCVE